MKEYDIYLKQRIHESKLFIYSIPYRDGISVANRLLLEAMLQYYTLQKMIAVENKSVLIVEIDNMLSIVREKISSSMEIQISADFLTCYYNDLKQNAIILNIPELPAFLHSFFDVQNALGIRISDVDAIAKSSLGNQLSSMIGIKAYDVDTKARAFAQAGSSMAVKAKINKTHKQAFEVISNELILDAPALDLFYCYTTGLETAMSIVAQISDIEIHYSLGDANSSMVITASDLGNSAKKHISISDEIKMFCQMAATVVSFFEANQGIEVQSAVNAGLKRYRLLKEVDDLELKDIDDITLEELDYVELT